MFQEKPGQRHGQEYRSEECLTTNKESKRNILIILKFVLRVVPQGYKTEENHRKLCCFKTFFEGNEWNLRKPLIYASRTQALFEYHLFLKTIH